MVVLFILTAPIWISCLSAWAFYKIDCKNKNMRPEIRYYFSKDVFESELKTNYDSDFEKMKEIEYSIELP